MAHIDFLQPEPSGELGTVTEIQVSPEIALEAALMACLSQVCNQITAWTDAADAAAQLRADNPQYASECGKIIVLSTEAAVGLVRLREQFAQMLDSLPLVFAVPAGTA